MTRGSMAPTWAKIAVVTLTGTVASLQYTLVIPLLPSLPGLLGVSDESASWLVTATLLTAAVANPDRVPRCGHVRQAAHVVGFARRARPRIRDLCGHELVRAPTGGRALQGFASSLIAVGISLLRDALPPDRVSTAVALMSATLGVGTALGLPLAGILADTLGWHAVFWFSAMAASLLLLGVMVLVTESPVRKHGRFDVGGAVLLSLALVALLLPIGKGSEWGWSSPKVLALATCGVVLIGAWVPLQLRVNQPMVDLRTAVKRSVLLTNLATFFLGFAMFTNMVLTINQLQLPPESSGLGLGVLPAGVAMLPSGLAMVVLSPVVGKVLHRWGDGSA